MSSGALDLFDPAQVADCWFLTGPTASGKTAVGLALAELLGAEIVSLDSMAVYRGMDLGTAKPTRVDRRRVPHHLLDIVEPPDEFSVAEYVTRAAAEVRAIRDRQREALFVGGTPLYLKSLLRGIFSGPAADWALRRRLVHLAQTAGPGALHQRLARLDPPTAQRLHPNDTRRVIRALEVYEITGRPISQFQRHDERAAAGRRVFVLVWPRDQLYERIDRRVHEMFAAGFVDEVRGLLAGGGMLGRTARQAVGYREVIDHLEGIRDLPSTIELVKTRTRQFAKRQLTWFRSMAECREVPVCEPLDPWQTAARIGKLAAEQDR